MTLNGTQPSREVAQAPHELDSASRQRSQASRPDEPASHEAWGASRGGVIVVGGGLAGLAVACYLARGGRSVTVLEKARSVGGRALTDTPHGYALNRGVHALYSGGPASDVLRELHVGYTSGSPKRIFALDERGLHRFPTSPLGFVRTTLLDARDAAELAGIFVRLGALRPASLAHEPCADWINRVARRARVRQLLTALARVYLYSSALDVVSADAFVERLKQTAIHPIHYIDGGWQTLVDGFRQLALSSGVRLVTSAGVESVRLRGGSARGVRLADAREVECSDVVLAVAPRDALHLVGSPLQHVLADSLPAQVACLDLALERLPAPAHPVGFDLEQPLFMTVQSEFARLAPRGGAVVHAFKQLDPRQPSDPHQDVADLDAFMDRLQPGWRQLVVERRVLPRIVAAGALPLASRGGLGGRANYCLDNVANLYFAGDWVGPRGFLVDASLDSAREVARRILSTQPHAGNMASTPRAVAAA
jgi:phytoene dehydrogenase-like protein